MKTWASLKEAMDKLGHEVRQVLLVRSDLGLLQDDLSTQENLWHKAEADLQQEIAQLAAQAKRLTEEVDSGAHIKEDVKSLHEKIREGETEAFRIKVEFDHAREEANLEERRLQTRARTLKQQLDKAEGRRKKEVQAALKGELKAKARTAGLERQLALLKDRLSDERSALDVERSSADGKARNLKGQLEDANAALTRLKSQLIPKSQVEADVAAMRGRLQQETQQMVEVQSAQVQLAAVCEKRTKNAEQALASERRKAEARRQETFPVCNTAREQHDLLKRLVTKTCGEYWAAGPSPQPMAALLSDAPSLQTND